MDNTLFTLLRNAISFFPAALICVLPVREHLRFTKKTVYICMVILNMLLAITCTSVNEWTGLSQNLVLFVALLPILFCYISCCKVYPPILIFIFVTAMVLMAFVSGIIDGICLTFFSNSKDYNIIYLGVLICFIIVFLTPIIYLFIRRTENVAFEYKNNLVWRILWIIPLTFTFILMLFPTYTSLDYLYASIILSIGCIIVYHTIFIMMEQSILATLLQEENMIKEKLLIIEQAQYKALSSGIEQARIANHDLRHHFNAIMAYSKSNQQDKVQAYIKQYLPVEQVDSLNVFCENMTINKMLSYYQTTAKSHGIKTDFGIIMSDTIDISEPDLWVLFGNCLENAIEACCRYEGSEKFIKLTARQQGKMLGITIDNSYQNKVLKDKNDHFLSSKAISRTGVGLRSVEAVVEKYQGMLEINYDGTLFCVSVMLTLSES